MFYSDSCIFSYLVLEYFINICRQFVGCAGGQYERENS
nr:MAG TPA: hypothetical protein [Caudoviricetes sp.]